MSRLDVHKFTTNTNTESYLFVLFLDVGTMPSKLAQQYVQNAAEHLKQELKHIVPLFKLLVIPEKNSTNVCCCQNKDTSTDILREVAELIDQKEYELATKLIKKELDENISNT